MNSIFCQLFRAAMVRQQLSQRALATRAGLGESALSEKLNNRRPFSIADIEALAGALGLDEPIKSALKGLDSNGGHDGP